MARMLRSLWCLSFLWPLLSFTIQAQTNDSEAFEATFPSKGVEHRVEFWKQVFTRYGENDLILHDRTDLRLVYRVVSFPGRPSNRAESRRQQAELQDATDNIKQVLDDLITLGPDSNQLNFKHHEMLSLLKMNSYQPTASVLSGLKDNIHIQRGIKEKFRAGLVRSGRYLEELEKIFKNRGLPGELSLLPHIESSFNYAAYSSAGAAGVWQITRGTGRKLLRIGRAVDERLDPLKSGMAAARILKENHDALGNWPLAVTAYNQGKNGILRAKNIHGADIGTIVNEYQSKIFGFAGQNFYAEFLAAVQIAKDHSMHFGDLPLEEPLSWRTVAVKRATSVSSFAKAANVRESVLRTYNPQLTAYFWKRSRVLPAGVEVRLPAGDNPPEVMSIDTPEPTQQASVEKAAASRKSSVKYRVRRGDTLTTIARRFQVRVDRLKKANRLRNPHQLYLGQMLLIP